MKYNYYIAECIWTFWLVFFWTWSVIVNHQTNGELWLLWISLVFGVIVTAMIYVFWSISWGHINPAVTITLMSNKGIKFKKWMYYIIAQILWAIMASLSLFFIFPWISHFWETVPTWSSAQSLIIEIIMTFFLMLVILGVSSSKNASIRHLSGIIIGIYIVGAIMLSGPISWGSFNPARSLAPAIFSWDFTHLWIYILWPIMWSIAAVKTWNMIQTEG